MRGAALGVVAVGVIAGVASVLAPDAVTEGILYNLGGVVAVAVAWWATTRMPPLPRRAWRWLVAGLACFVAGDMIWDAYEALRGEAPTVSVADVLYVAGYPAMAVGIVLLIRVRAPDDDREGLVDSLAVGVAAGLAVYAFLVAPALREGGTLLESVVAASYPFGDVLLLGALTWLVLAPGRRGPATWLLYGHLVTMLVVDVALAVLYRFDQSIALLDAVYPLSYALLAAAALQPDASDLGEPGAPGIRRIHPGRTLLLGIALVTAPLLASLDAGASPTSRVVYLVAALLVALLALQRFTHLVRDREELDEELAFRASHDQLTGLVNRSLLVDRIEHALLRAERHGSRVALLYIDLDRFKSVNDGLGHAAGDELLVHVAHRMRFTVRASETVARIGGDEFAILCEDLEGPAGAVATAERLLGVLAQPFRLTAGPAFVTGTIGIAVSDDGTTAETLIHDADAAMYRAKRAGKNRWDLFDEAMRAWAARRLDAEQALHGALGRGEIRLEYQPVVRLGSAEVVGFEALLRWQRENGDEIPPSEFVPLAEDIGCIDALGAWALEQAVRQVHRWNEDRPDRAPLRVAVNVSPRQLAKVDFARDVERTLAHAGLAPESLVLEITESVVVERGSLARSHLESLRRAGVRIAIDDFGTGYSALAYLRDYPLDILKIDRSFVAQIGAVRRDHTVVDAVIALAHTLGLQVVAEGIETAPQRDALLALGCDLAQGYFYSRPLAARAAEGFIAEHDVDLRAPAGRGRSRRGAAARATRAR